MITGSSAGTSWLAYCRPSPESRLRLFCFPYAGGGASVYRTWAEGLPPTVDLCPVQLPGRETRIIEPPFTRIGSLVEAASHALRSYFDRPFCFFGHSMGAIVAFELARHLRRVHGLEPAHLIVSAYPAPQACGSFPLRHDLPPDEFLREIVNLQGTPKEVLASPELMELVVPVIRADLAVCELYEYVDEPPLSCPITVCGGVNDSESPRSTLEGWCRHTSGRFALRMFPGDHFFISTSRRTLLELLSSELLRLLQEGERPRP